MENSPGSSTAPSDPRDATIAALEARLETLEKSVERLEKWRRKLKEGTEFLNLGYLQIHCLELQFEGKRRGWLSAEEDGAIFSLYDGDQQKRVSLEADSSEYNSTMLQIFGNQKREVALAVNAEAAANNGGTAMNQYEEAVRLGLGPDGGLLALFDGEAKPCVVARGKNSGGSVAITNKNGQALAVLASTDEGGTVQVLPDTWDELASEQRIPVITARLEAKAEGGSLVVRDGKKPDGGAFATISVKDEQTILLMGDENCEQRVALSAMPQITSLQLRHGVETPRVFASSTAGLASVSLKNHDSQNLADWTAISDSQNAKSQQCAFYLNDSQGNQRVGAVAADSFASLRVSDGQERDRISVLVSDDAAILRVSDENGIERVALQAKPEILLRDKENRVVGLFDSNHGGRISLFAPPSPNEDLEPVSEEEVNGETESGTVAVLKRGTSFLHGPATRQRVVLAANPEGAGLVLHGGQSEEQLLLSVGENTSHLQINDRDGTPNLDLRSTDEGGQLRILGDSGAPRVFAGVREDFGLVGIMRLGGDFDAILSADEHGGQLLLFDENNEPSATLPEL